MTGLWRPIYIRPCRKLREALDDSAENPRFVETRPRRGYRFIGTADRIPEAGVGAAVPADGRRVGAVFFGGRGVWFSHSSTQVSAAAWIPVG